MFELTTEVDDIQIIAPEFTSSHFIAFNFYKLYHEGIHK